MVNEVKETKTKKDTKEVEALKKELEINSMLFHLSVKTADVFLKNSIKEKAQKRYWRSLAIVQFLAILSVTVWRLTHA